MKLKKILAMVMTAAMLLGSTGCSMLSVKAPQNGRQELDVEKNNVTAEKKEDAGNDAAQDTAENKTDAKTEEKQDTAAKEENKTEDKKEDDVATVEVPKDKLMSDYFIQKMELLEYLVEQYYMNDISVEDMQTGAYKGLLEGLGDPYTCYYTAEEYEALMESTTGTYYGIGSYVQQNTKTMIITIVKPFKNGPAHKAGLLPGDIIYKVDDMDVSGMEIDKVTSMMKGPAGTTVKLTVIREGVADPIDMIITRAKVEVETIEYEMLQNNIGYIAISGFEEVTPKQFKTAVEDLQKNGAKGLVFDLRDNGGGLLSAVVDMLNYLLPEGTIVYTIDKYGEKEEYRSSKWESLELPMAVLINGNSASASEIFAAAMQDFDAAEIVGTTSFGKGIVQTILPLTDGTAVKITISRYFTPKGVCIHGVGVTPDVEVELKAELKQQVEIRKEEDNQLQEAVKVLLEKMK